jgi:hypothetical protein
MVSIDDETISDVEGMLVDDGSDAKASGSKDDSDFCEPARPTDLYVNVNTTVVVWTE